MISGNKTVVGKVKKQGNEGEEKENVTTLKAKGKTYPENNIDIQKLFIFHDLNSKSAFLIYLIQWRSSCPEFFLKVEVLKSLGISAKTYVVAFILVKM